MITNSTASIYLDYHATTPCDQRVVDAMLPFMTELFANPSSPHRDGIAAAHAVATARQHVSQLIGAQPGEIVFTGSATESNNLAILGLIGAIGNAPRVVLTSSIEHKSVSAPMAELERRGLEVQVVQVDGKGKIELDEYECALSHEPSLVSIQAANSEIGTVQDIPKLARMAHDAGAVFHCDATQAVGRISVDVDHWNVDLMSFSAHKFYGPKGVAALFIRGGSRQIPLLPLLFGGGQENEIRPGTPNVPGIVGFGEASRVAHQVLPEEAKRISELRDVLERDLVARIQSIRRNGNLRSRLPGNSSLTIPGVDAEALIAQLPELAISSGSACNTGALEPSPVLTAIGVPREEAAQTIRIGVGRFTARGDIDQSACLLADAVTRIIAIGSR